MRPDDLVTNAQSYLETLCAVKPNRRSGSSGNREATTFFANTVSSFGFEIDATPFACLDYTCGDSLLLYKDKAYDVHISPYSLGCEVAAELVAASTVEELERTHCKGKILLMKGAVCSEQLMPKNFVFYNPEHHQRLISLLESQAPAGMVTATARSPEQVGALYPFPLIVDGDFHIPSVYCTDALGDELAALQGQVLRLNIDARRLPSCATNVIARMNQGAAQRIVITAHIDAYEDSPGASDNASGTVVLLLLASMLSDYRGDHSIEIVALNGEDHYSVAGQMDYLRRFGSEFDRIRLVINTDDVGYVKGKSSYSFYECPSSLQTSTEDVLRRFDGLTRGDSWFNGDHMIFVQNGVAALAFTAEFMPELMRTVTHTALDTPDLIDCSKLVEIAQGLNALVRALSH